MVRARRADGDGSDEPMIETMKPSIVVRAEMAPAPTLWVCQTTRSSPRYYVAARPVQIRTGYANTARVEEAARFPTRESAERHRPLGDANGGEAFAFSEEDGRLLCFPPNRWESAEATPVAYLCPPEPPCIECGGVMHKHNRSDCNTLREQVAAIREVQR